MLSPHRAIKPPTYGHSYELKLKQFRANLNRMSNVLDGVEAILNILKRYKEGPPKVRAQILSRVSVIINGIVKFFITPEWAKISDYNSDMAALCSLCDKAKQYSFAVKADVRQILISVSKFTKTSIQVIEENKPRGVSSGLTFAENNQLNQLISSIMSNVMEYSIQWSGCPHSQSRLSVKAKVKLNDISGVDPNLWKYNLRMKSSLVTSQIGGVVDISTDMVCFFKAGNTVPPNSVLAASVIQLLSDIY